MTEILSIYCINLDRAKNRWNSINEQAINNNLNIIKFSAIDYLNLEKGHPFLKRGQVGCFMSHYKLWEKIQYTKTSIILEDDILLVENFTEKLKLIYDETQDISYDMILLGHNHMFGDKLPVTSKIGSIRGNWCGTHAYIITPKCAKILCNIFKDINSWNEPLDGIFGTISLNKTINTLAALEKIVVLGKLAGSSDTNRA